MLTELQNKRLERIFSELKLFDETLIDGKTAYHFLETEMTEQGELLIRGNVEGMVHLACAVLSLTQNPFDGKHRHFDDTGMLDKCETPLIVSFKNADWDEEELRGNSEKGSE